MKGLEGKYVIITEDYTDSEVGVWSGWRDLTSHVLLTSQPVKMLCNFNNLNYKNPMCLTSQTCDKLTKISLKV